ncbi:MULTISPECIES: hypothetical protein [Campylobacter]|uniref:Uncharacterized protein n=1 Tax=Campylobacter porcelli TaxID=1660073 RepID=A0ABU7M480_9BACT|nr:hypothetical protein [Campylobacter sp. P0124]MCR8696237.1 hypothetical protein [Campylobacter sp. RM19073]MEE3705035.1 hypothetical protein [Campylobacter sp. CX2-8023-23]MEE3744519.1 hypothetical protein [Campylobacter sp. CX2-4855-23]MEE3776985.1 hypothetical protein [Campylobacter sp. CX2-4080-23]
MNNEKVFISGSISIKKLPDIAKETLDKIIYNNFEILVGDAAGIDTLIQEYCNRKNYDNITVCYIGDEPRNLVDPDFKTKKVNIQEQDKTEIEKLTRKDIKMTEYCTYSFVIWDEKSSGSYENIMRALNAKKFVKVCLTKSQKYCNSKEDNFKNNIENIYTENTGIKKEKFIELLRQSNPDNPNLKNTKKFNEFLVKNKIVKKDENDKYIPADEYKKYFIEKRSKGKFVSYNFTNKLYATIEELIKKDLTQNLFDNF